METSSSESVAATAFRHKWRAFQVLVIDLAFITAYALVIGAASVLLRLWVHHIEATHALGVSELVPFKFLGWWLAWMSCLGAAFAATATFVESVTGRNTVLRSTINDLKRRFSPT